MGMIPAAKLLRCLQMINLLKRKRLKPAELGQAFGVDKRTAYRYLRLFEAVGYCVDKDFKGRYFIFGRLKKIPVENLPG
jgi:DNA-binding IclR family transcriptional regulator